MYRDLCLFTVRFLIFFFFFGVHFGLQLFYSLFVAVIFMQRSVTDVFYTEDALRGLKKKKNEKKKWIHLFADIFVREEFIKADAPNMYKAFPDIGEVVSIFLKKKIQNFNQHPTFTKSEFWQWTLGPFLNAVSQTK